MLKRAVLGIDAAWTETNASGLALAAETSAGWELVAVAPSYQSFISDSGGRCVDSIPKAPDLLEACQNRLGRPVNIVAIDMPLSNKPIIGRRAADDAVSRAYGGRKCGTHTPSSKRPGKISDNLRKGFALAGYPLLTTAMSASGLIEVYPHPALIELATAPERLKYKVGKARNYWPSLSPAERRQMLLRSWAEIAHLLEREIRGVITSLPTLGVNPTGVQLKSFEDILDAIVCAWVAICALDGRVRGFGDDDAAIWVPMAG
jgi:predicted RNase H-like nuclease